MALTEALSQTTKNLSKQPVILLRFEPSTFTIRAYSATPMRASSVSSS
jgi:hypothetical protein